jgi:glycosyltransferase involved in cell wall biosynthesis
MRVLVITNRYPVDRDDVASPFVPFFVQALENCGLDVDVLTPDYGHARGDASASVNRFPTGAKTPIGSWNLVSPVTWWRIWRFFRNGKQAGRRLCRENEYDHILALWALPSGHLARALSRRFGVPYSVWCLGSDIYVWARRPVIRRYTARILKGARRVFADGEELCDRIRAGFGVKCRFLPSFRPLSALVAPDSPDPTDTPHFLYLGRIHEAKGVHELVQAFLRVRDRLPGATLRFVGDGPATEKLRDMIALQVAAEVIRIDGPLDHDGLINALRDCDFVVIPSKSDSLPLVFSEAVQANRPVIGTDVGDLGRFIQRYRVGAVATSLDPRDLAAAMLDMARAPILDVRGRENLLRVLDPNRAAQTFLETVLNLRPGSGMAYVRLPMLSKAGVSQNAGS